MTTRMLAAAVAAAVGGSALAGGSPIVVDGSLDAVYYGPLAIQNVQTQFGDSNLGLLDYANGSELDVGDGFIMDGSLYLFLGGNLESNFNKLEIFLDGVSGEGQNKLRGDNPDVDFNGLNRMGDDGTGNGLTFDAEFAADYYITTTCGGDPFATYANTAELLTFGGGSGGYIGSGGAGGAYLDGSNGVQIAIDNSNTGGVGGGTRTASGAGVTTGIEIVIPLDLIPGYAGEAVKVTAFINGGGHDFVSNQILAGAGGGTGNLGEPRNVNFDLIGGAQHFTVPIPGDANGDGVVDPTDLAIVLGDWGGATAGDFNHDGIVDAVDLAIVLGAWTVPG